MTGADAIDVTPLAEAMWELAARDPDRAEYQNAEGFSASDGPAGHGLALLPPQQWTQAAARQAWELARRYRRQLDSAGIRFEDLPEPAEPKDYDEPAIREELRQVAHAHRDQASRRITLEQGELRIRFDYNETLLPAVRAIPGRRFNRRGRQDVWWSAPVTSHAEIRAFAAAHRFAFDPADLDQAARQAAGMPSPQAQPITATFASGDLVVAFPGYDPEKVPALKQRAGGMARFDFANKQWHVPLQVEDAAGWRELLTSWDAALSRDLIRWLDEAESEHADRLRAEAAAARARAERLALSAALNGAPPVPGMPDLKPHQLVAPAYAAAVGWQFCIGDPMGLGKSAMALACLKVKPGGLPALLVVPANVKHNWAEEAERWLPGASVHVVTGRSPYPLPAADLTVINYDLLGGATGKGSRNDPLTAKPGTWCEVFTDRFVPASLIVDESHYCMHRRSGRTRAVLAIAGTIRARHADPAIITLTGTPVPNGRPEEILPQLDLLGRLPDLGGGAHVRRLFAAGKAVEFHRQLRSTCYLRRRKRGQGGIFPDLPEPDRRQVLVGLDPEVMRVYEQAEQNIIRHLAEQARQLAAKTGDDPDGAAAQAVMRARAAEHLVQINALRQLVARAKLPAAMASIDEFLTRRRGKLLVFADHNEVVHAIGCRYQALVIDGNTTGADRTAVKEAFQNDPTRRVMVCSIMAAAVGLTLTAAHDVLFVEQAWRPGDLSQAEGRAYGRVNDLHGITATYLVGPDTIDEWMRALLEQKQRVIAAVEDGQAPADAEQQARESVLGAIVVGLTRKGLGATDPIAGEVADAQQAATDAEDYAAQVAAFEARVLTDTRKASA